MKEYQLKRLIMYQKIKELLSQNFKVAQISRELGISRKTIYKYLSVAEPAFTSWAVTPKQKTLKLAAYEGFVRDRLEKYPDLSAAQVHDWLKEHYDNIEASSKTVFNFVAYVRLKYNLSKQERERDFVKVAELPYGQQAQVDFGQHLLRDAVGRSVRIYFMSMVLSRSRYKYVYLRNAPFTTVATIEAHEKAFCYFGGIPQQIVYDQDRVMVVDENLGDIILTQAFRQYVNEKKFTIHLCRKADPQSKGKIERVIGYVKHNFLQHRTYTDIDELNQQALEWLSRTGNANLHRTIMKVPMQEYLIEKNHLQPYYEPYTVISHYRTYTVRKDNTISYQGNFYTLPIGTYNSMKTVHVGEDAGWLIVLDGQHEIARHRKGITKGQLISNASHYRDRNTTIALLIEQTASLVDDSVAARNYLNALHKHYPRYAKDQLRYIEKAIKATNDTTIAERTIEYCCKNSLYTSTRFIEILAYFSQKTVSVKPVSNEISLSTLRPDDSVYTLLPQRSDINLYEDIVNKNQ